MTQVNMFNGAKNIKITGGNFSVVTGNVHHYDMSRHTTNNDSFNTRSTSYVNSNNKNGIQNNTNPYQRTPPDYGGPHRNPPYSPYGSGTPSPSVHPHSAMHTPPSHGYPSMNSPPPPQGYYGYNQHAPPPPQGYREMYGPPSQGYPNQPPYGYFQQPNMEPPRTSDMEEQLQSNEARRRKKGKKSNASPQDAGEEEDIPSPTGHKAYSTRSRQNQRASPSTSWSPNMPKYSAGPFGSNTQISNGQISTMSPEMQREFDALMRRVEEETAPSDEDESDSEEEDPPLDQRMANMGINDPSPSRPVLSQVKSDPQPPLPTNTPNLATRQNQPQAESTPEIPQHLQDQFAAYSAAPHLFPPQRDWHSPWGGSPPAQYPRHASPPGPALYPQESPSVVHIDTSAHTTNNNSGNVKNKNIIDSYNDNSTTTQLSRSSARKSNDK